MLYYKGADCVDPVKEAHTSPSQLICIPSKPQPLFALLVRHAPQPPLNVECYSLLPLRSFQVCCLPLPTGISNLIIQNLKVDTRKLPTHV